MKSRPLLSRYRPLLLVLQSAVLLLLPACTPGSRIEGIGEVPWNRVGASAEEPARRSLEKNLVLHAGFLASDELAGREVGTRGIAVAERYIANTLSASGLTPLPGERDFFLEFSVYRGGYDPQATRLIVANGYRRLAARAGRDFRPFPFSALGSAEADLVFAGYGITAPEYGYDDYAELDVEGKIVLLLRYEPRSPDDPQYFKGADLTRHALFLTKVRNAQTRGAAGLILVTDPKSGAAAEDFRLGGPVSLQPQGPSAGSSRRERIPAVHVSEEFAGQLLAQSSFDLIRLQNELDGGSAPADLSIGEVTVKLDVALKRDLERIEARNVAAFLPGADPQLRDEWILVGAHHDHLGSFQGSGDTIFNGADDNASGVAALLTLAGVLAEHKADLQRSVVFTTFSAEEWGLHGSRAMTEGQLPVDRIRLMVNFDMIGRNPGKPVQIMGSDRPQLEDLVEEANREPGLAIRYIRGAQDAVSDYYPFHNQGIPFLFFFSGIHPDYHGTADHAEKLSYTRMAEIVDLATRVVLLAGRDPLAPQPRILDS